MTSMSEESAHARNRFENRRLRKTMEHIAFTQKYATSRIDDEIRNVRDSLRDIRLNTGHSSNMDSEGVRSFCRGEYTGNRQRRAAEQIERGECFDWTLTLERDASTVRVPDTERRHRSSKKGVRRSASLATKTSHTELPEVGDENEALVRRSSSFHNSNKRASIRKSRQERASRTTFPNPLPPDSRVKRSESFQDSRSRPSSGLRRSSSVQSLVSCSGKRSMSVERTETVPLVQLDTDVDVARHVHTNHETVKFPQISKGFSGSIEALHSRKEHAKGKRKVGRKSSETNDIDLTQLVQELMLEDLTASESGSPARSRREPSVDRKRAKLKVLPKKVRPDPPILAWAPNSSSDLTLPALASTDPRARSSASCPLPERQNPETSKTHLRKLSCPEEDEQTKLRSSECDIDEDDVFSTSGGDPASATQEEEEVPLSRYERRKKVLNARAAHSGMSLAELIAKRQGDIKVAMSPRQLRRIREQIILQRNRRDYNPSAGEQARFRQIEDKIRSFLDQEIFSSENGSGTDSYNSEEEGSLV